MQIILLPGVLLLSDEAGGFAQEVERGAVVKTEGLGEQGIGEGSRQTIWADSLLSLRSFKDNRYLHTMTLPEWINLLPHLVYESEPSDKSLSSFTTVSLHLSILC